MPLRTQSSLDVNDAELQQISSESSKLVTEYMTTITERQVRAENHAGKTLAAIDTELSSEGRPVQQLIEECRKVMDLSRHNGHPRFFGYVASPSTPIGAYGDLIASALNSNITCWRSGAAGTEIERMIVRWLGALIGYDDKSKGLLTSGGSMANMIALMIAQRRKSLVNTSREGLWYAAPMTIYASEEVHMSIPKAADILGFGRDNVRTIACDERQRMRVDLLRQQIQTDVSKELRPFCVVASAGTTNTGVVDPLNAIADVAAEFDLWFHVDGAYGAPGSLDAGKKSLFAGLERANSVSLDPHKWLYVPIDAGCLLFRNEAAARAAFSTGEEADYVKTLGYSDEEAFAFWDYGVELSRRFRALKVWLTLQYYGSRRIAQAISEDIALAAYLGESVSNAEDFELLAQVELSICCFRYVPRKGMSDQELDQLNEKIMETVQKGGRTYLSNATVNGKFALRACITNFRTTKSDIDETIAVIRDAAKK